MRAVVFFLLETVAFLLVGGALLRAWMNHLRVNMSVQPGRFVMALTHWLVGPVRKLLPRPLAQSAVDWGSLMAAVLLALAYGGIWMTLQVAMSSASVSPASALLAIALLAAKLLVRVLLQGLMVLLLIYAVLSWVQPGSPLMATLDRLCRPVLAPIRRVLPLIGGVDLSVLVMIVLLQVGLILLG
jgi:YggT family protein